MFMDYGLVIKVYVKQGPPVYIYLWIKKHTIANPYCFKDLLYLQIHYTNTNRNQKCKKLSTEKYFFS